MDFTNINDPAGVKSLLEQLRTSQAWQDTVDQNPQGANETTANPPPAEPGPIAHSSSNNSEGDLTRSSVASLLSQLQSSPSWSAAVPAPPNHSYPPTKPAQYVSGARASAPPATLVRSPSHGVPSQDVRSYNFQQALPHLAQLSDDPDFVASLSKLKQEQTELERQLFRERCAIQTKHEEKVKAAQAKAKIIGAGLSKHEADMMSDAYRKEMNKFATERVLIAWDGLVVKQQAALENMRVPAMFVTDVEADRERQQRVVQILEGIAGSADG